MTHDPYPLSWGGGTGMPWHRLCGMCQQWCREVRKGRDDRMPAYRLCGTWQTWPFRGFFLVSHVVWDRDMTSMAWVKMRQFEFWQKESDGKMQWYRQCGTCQIFRNLDFVRRSHVAGHCGGRCGIVGTPLRTPLEELRDMESTAEVLNTVIWISLGRVMRQDVLVLNFCLLR